MKRFVGKEKIMIVPKDIIRTASKTCYGMIRDFRQRLKKDTNRESVFFYTLHKCASTLFGQYVLKHVEGLSHTDYEVQYFQGTKRDKAVFASRGFVYGPIRVSVMSMEPVFSQFTKPASDPDFVRDKKIIFLVRDPRDVLVSSYYSFAYSHPVSPNPEIRTQQEIARKIFQTQSLDEFVLFRSTKIAEDFHQFIKLIHACRRCVVLTYEDMIENYDVFIRELTRFITLKRRVIRNLYVQSRPLKKENISAHRRSGRVGGFRDKLLPETIRALNEKFAEALSFFGYTP